MVVMSSKDEEAQQHELPSYFSADGFPLVSDSKEGFTESPPPIASTSSDPAPITSPNPNPNHISSPYYAPAPAPFSHSAALTASNSSTITPLSFSRARAQGPAFTYGTFKPMFLLASSNKSTSLSNGFPMTAPPSKEDPHPFVTHDVNEIDWLQFLNDVCAAGSLTEKEIQRSYIPIVSWVPFVGSLSVYGVQKFMKSRKSSTVAKTFDTWNHHFFQPRKMRIVLMRGNERLSGLQESSIGGLRSPEPVNVSSGIMDHAIGRGNDTKGKGKEDGVYRLFVLSI